MTPASLLADHEGLYEFSRMSRAIVVGLILAAVAAYVYRRVRSPWGTMAGRLAIAGLAVAMVTIGLGLVPRDTASGYIICGPPLNVPDSIPAFTNAGTDWADSQSCNELMEAPMWWLLVGIVGAAALFAAAHHASLRARVNLG